MKQLVTSPILLLTSLGFVESMMKIAYFLNGKSTRNGESMKQQVQDPWKSTLWYINIDPGSYWGWKTSFHYKLVIFRVYVNLPEGICFFRWNWSHKKLQLTTLKTRRSKNTPVFWPDRSCNCPLSGLLHACEIAGLYWLYTNFIGVNNL